MALHPGSTGAVEVSMTPDPNQAAAMGLLSVSVDQSQAVLWVDGQPRLDVGKSLRVPLPIGRHLLKVQRSGFYDAEREVDVGVQDHVEIELSPTSEYMADYVDSAKSQRVWAWATIGASMLVSAGSGAFLLYYAKEEDDAKQSFDDFGNRLEREEASGMCPGSDRDELEALLNLLEDVRDRNLWGWLGLGIGGAGLITGVVLLTSSEDPNRYDPELDDDVASSVQLRLAPAGMSLSGRF